jgi:hypothetical protein
MNSSKDHSLILERNTIIKLISNKTKKQTLLFTSLVTVLLLIYYVYLTDEWIGRLNFSRLLQVDYESYSKHNLDYWKNDKVCIRSV